MKLYTIAIATGLVAGFGTANVSVSDTNTEFQTITIPSQRVEFKRGTYKIISLDYTQETILSNKEVIEILKLAGFRGSELKMAWAIAVKESTLRPYALNKKSNCYGLFQINMTGSMGPSRREKYGLVSNDDLFNPLVNAKIAYQMSNGGKNWSAWSTEKSALRSLDEFPTN